MATMPLFYAHATRLRNASWTLMGRTGYSEGNAPRPLTSRELARLQSLRTEVEALVTLLRPITAGDRAWKYYDKDVMELERHLDPESYTGQTGYATGKLHQMLDMVGGAASRGTYDNYPEWHPVVRELATIAGDPARSVRDRREARVVLQDALEELGRGDVADVVRLDRANVDRFLLPFLRGERLAPKPRPYRRR